MMQAGQLATAPRLDTSVRESALDIGASLQRVDEAIDETLARVPATTNVVSEGKAVADATRSCFSISNSADSSLLASFPPQPRPTRRRAALHVLQEWGHVVDIGDEEFMARLVDLTADRSRESEEVVVPLAEISEFDVPAWSWTASFDG